MYKMVHQTVTLVHVGGHSSPVVAHMQLQTRKGTSPVYNTCIHPIVFKLCMTKKKERKKSKSKLFVFGFLDFDKHYQKLGSSFHNTTVKSVCL